MKKLPQDYLYSLPLKVRDYECDLQGVVNNANYLHYMEHTRHEFWLQIGESFALMHERGWDAFVYKICITYKASLRSGEEFISCLDCKHRGAKLVFEQAIYKKDGTLCTIAEVETVMAKDGIITRGEYFTSLMERVREFAQQQSEKK